MEAGRGRHRTINPQNIATSSSLGWSLSVYSNQGHWIMEILCSWHTWEKIIQPPADLVWILSAEPTLPWTSGATLLAFRCICHLFKPWQVPLLYTQFSSVGFHRLDWFGFSQGFPWRYVRLVSEASFLKPISCLNTFKKKKKIKFQLTCPDVAKQA